MSQVRPIEDLFGELIAIESPKEREAFLEHVGGSDAALGAQLEKLLAAHEQAGSFLQDDESIDQTADFEPSDLTGTSIGPYKLREIIGDGGMGVVYVAERRQPYHDKVALKLIKPGMDSKAVLARFDAERQALALMKHPNIAKILDAGTTPQGHPFFVMELVNGSPITEYCDDHQLTIRERLELFVEVCQAIQHAHQKGIIHRDIKPSNVLVTELDGKPVPKVIDFGVAKALNQSLTDRTIYTSFQAVIGTPLYMAPEQASLSAVDVDTRSDVYSLGVLLYELLTGTTPFDMKDLKRVARNEVLQFIREQEPPRPSNRLSTLGDSAIRVSHARRTQPEQLGRLVKGDLDWIVMTALEKERGRRYATADALAMDIGHHVRSEPVGARPPTATYRLSKFVFRNRSLLVAVCAVVLALCAGIAGTAWYALKESETNRRLETTVARLIDGLVRQTVTAAMSGNAAEAKAYVSEAETAGADPRLCKTLRGMVDLYSGYPAEAMDTIDEVLANDPQDPAALCILWSSSLYSGDPRRFSECIAGLGSYRPPSGNDLERLLFAQVNLYRDPNLAAECLGPIIETRKSWSVLQALYGSALVQQISDETIDGHTLGRFETALRHFETARSIAPTNRFVQTEYLMALTYAIEFAEIHSLAQPLAKWRTLGDELAREIEGDDTRGSQWSHAIRAYYLAAIHGADHAPLVEELALLSSARRYSVQAARYYLNGNSSALRALSLQSKGPFVPVTLAYAEVEAKDGRNKIRLAREIYMDRFAKEQKDFAWDGDQAAISVLLFAGDLDFASRRANALLKMPHAYPDRWNERCLRYIASPDKEREAELLSLAEPYSAHRAYAHTAVAMVAHARGERDKAERYYRSVVNAGRIDWSLYHSAKMFLERMNDPNWPNWIRRTDLGPNEEKKLSSEPSTNIDSI